MGMDHSFCGYKTGNDKNLKINIGASNNYNVAGCNVKNNF